MKNGSQVSPGSHFFPLEVLFRLHWRLILPSLAMLPCVLDKDDEDENDENASFPHLFCRWDQGRSLT